MSNRQKTAITTNLQLFFLIALLAHTGRGSSPAISRYFQVVAGLPLMAFVFIGGVPAVLGYFFYTLPKSGMRVWRQPIIWAMGGLIIVRVISNVAAARFTNAIYVQLFALMTPFVVVVLSRVFLKEKEPPYTWMAIILSSVGALLILSTDISRAGISLDLTPLDQLGILLAIVQAVVGGTHFVLLRRAKQQDIPDHEIITTQSMMVVLVTIPWSFARGEDWSTFLQLSGGQWALLIGWMVITVFGANWLQVVAISRIGAHAFSSALAWRLLTVMVISWFLLGERLESAWQVVGAVIVFVTITAYFWLQRET